MPALPDVNNVIRIDYGFTIGEDTTARCREFWQFGGTPSSADLLTLATTIADDWSTAGMPALYPASTSLTSVTITNLTSPTAGQATFATNKVGTASGGILPANVALLESLKVARRYRGGHPRNYWPFGADTALADDQKWTSVFVASCTAALLAWRNDWTTDLPASISSVQQVNVSFYSGFTVFTGPTGRMRNISKPRTNAVVDLIVSTVVQIGIAAIRRRLLRLA